MYVRTPVSPYCSHREAAHLGSVAVWAYTRGLLYLCWWCSRLLALPLQPIKRFSHANRQLRRQRYRRTVQWAYVTDVKYVRRSWTARHLCTVLYRCMIAFCHQLHRSASFFCRYLLPKTNNYFYFGASIYVRAARVHGVSTETVCTIFLMQFFLTAFREFFSRLPWNSLFLSNIDRFRLTCCIEAFNCDCSKQHDVINDIYV